MAESSSAQPWSTRAISLQMLFHEAAACRKDRRLWRVYLVFGLCVGLFFLFFYAIPYSRAL